MDGFIGLGFGVGLRGGCVAVARVIRARYEGGVLKPLEEVDLREGEEVDVMVIRRRFQGFHERFRDLVVESDSDLLEEFLKERR